MIQPSSPVDEPNYSANLFASHQPDDDTMLIGGTTLEESEWVQQLTRRAARALWFDLTRLLFPEKSDQVLASVSTMPSMPVFTVGESNLTSWTFVTGKPDGSCQISGWVGKPGWTIHLSALEVYRFWAALDVALFPTGW